MLEMSINNILNIIQILVCFVYLPFIFFKRQEKWNLILRLVLAIILIIIYLEKIFISIQIQESYTFNVILAVIWLINVGLLLALFLKSDTSKKNNKE